MKYLILCGSGIGDVAMLIPAARSIKRADPDAYIKLFCRSDQNRIKVSRELIGLQNWIDDIDYYSTQEKLHSLHFLLRLGYRHYDWGIVVEYTDHRDTSLWPWRIVRFAAKKSCGVEVKHQPKLQYDVMVPRVAGSHIMGHFERALQAIGIPSEQADQCVLDRAKLEELFRAIPDAGRMENAVLLNLGATALSRKVNGTTYLADIKAWPMERWFELARKLAEDGQKVVLMGGPGERKKIRPEWLESLPDHVVDAVGRYPLGQSLAIMSAARLAVGLDTGLMHCAGALGVPSLSLFGGTDPREYLPMGGKSEYIQISMPCQPCFGEMRMLECKDYPCMKQITVDMVYHKTMEILKNEDQTIQ